jgi:hypothetical protein
VLSVHASDAAAAAWSVTNWHVIAVGDGQLLRTIVGPLGPTWSRGGEEQKYVLVVIAVLVAARRAAVGAGSDARADAAHLGVQFVVQEGPDAGGTHALVDAGAHAAGQHHLGQPGYHWARSDLLRAAIGKMRVVVELRTATAVAGEKEVDQSTDAGVLRDVGRREVMFLTGRPALPILA